MACCNNIKTNVPTKFSTGPSTIICIFLMMALLLEPVESPVMIAPPNILPCRSNWSAKTSWRLAEPIGSSDHILIIIKLNHKICYKPVIPRSALWCRNGADLSYFTNEVEAKMHNLPHLFELHASITSSSLPQLLTLENLNPARNLNLG